MDNSYDSITQRRRPVIRVTLATLAVGVIFGASVSAASVSEVEVAGDISLEIGAAALAAPVDVAPEFDPAEPAPEASTVEPDAVDLSALADVNAAARLEAVRTDSGDLQSQSNEDGATADSDALIGSAVIDNDASAASIADALGLGRNQEVDVLAVEDSGSSDNGASVEVLSNTLTTSNESADRIDIDSFLQDRDTAVAELEAQALAVRQAQAAAEAEQVASLSVGEQAVVLAAELGTANSEGEAQAAWDVGYALGGGSSLSAFHNTILPCESGSQANRDSVVGATDDWGRAQVNRPVWRTTFESLTGVSFEENIIHPTLNGYMAAYIEEVQGLTAWTCWRNR